MLQRICVFISSSTQLKLQNLSHLQVLNQHTWAFALTWDSEVVDGLILLLLHVAELLSLHDHVYLRKADTLYLLQHDIWLFLFLGLH